ncbi:iron uptake porin [Microcoleus sp. D3_18a_C4]|uniref:iron uptake porin n=1 Tax=Microcoleus sp. D3_18a_C4 TaxID=3055332 RepID=UPI002FD6777A
MTEICYKNILFGLACLSNVLLTNNAALATESQVAQPTSQETVNFIQEIQELTEEIEPLGQITSVSQLSDVQPTDWAFEAVRSLVERYGCLQGYPDGSYRGNRAMTRYEFAAGLNACLNRMNELISSGTANLVKKEELAAIQKLQEEFAVELATLRGRVDALEARTSELEANQFSTTTKLSGQLITFLGDAFGENASDVNNPSFNYRLRLTLNTSFTGKDNLIVQLQSHNIKLFDTGATFGGSVAAASAGVSDETRFVTASGDPNTVTLRQLEYQFPVGDRLRIYLNALAVDASFLTDTVTPFIDPATAGISNFGQVNPMYVPTAGEGGIGFNFNLSNNFRIDGGYFGEAGSVSSPRRGSGLFNGGYTAFAQLLYTSDRLKVGVLYINSYSPKFGTDTLAGSNAAKIIQVNGEGAFNNPVVANSYAIQANYRLSRRFEVGGWLGYQKARALGDVKGDADVWNYAVNLNFPDLIKEGNQGGIVLGMQPRLAGTSNSALAEAIGVSPGQRKDRDVGFHLEGFYRYQINDNISITPGVIWLTAPNHDKRNPDTVIFVIRTSFLF